MSVDGCILKYGIAKRGFCNLEFAFSDVISSQQEKKIGYGDVAKFMLEENDSSSGPFYYAMSASCNIDGLYFYKTYEHEMVKFGSIIPSDYEDDTTDYFEIMAEFTTTDGTSLKNDVLGHPEIVVGEYNTPEQEYLMISLKIYPFTQTTDKYEFIKAQTVKINFDNEVTVLRDSFPQVYGKSPLTYTQVQSSNSFDCQVQDFDT